MASNLFQMIRRIAPSCAALALVYSTAATAGTFLEEGPPLSEPGRSARSGLLPSKDFLDSLQKDDRGLTYIGDMAFKADQIGRLGFSGRKWPQGIVPIAFADNVSDANKKKFFAACAVWSSVAAVRCIPRTSQKNYISVHSGKGNWSEVGMQGGKQDMEIANWDIRMVIAHEIAHALGGGHEQSRQDRDDYVEIVASNIEKGQEHNFKKLPLKSFTGYDFQSIMHYRHDAFSISNAATIVPRPGYEKFASFMGNMSALSEGDKESMRRQYGAPSGVMPLEKPQPPTQVSDGSSGASAGGNDSGSWTSSDSMGMPSLDDDPRVEINKEGEGQKIYGGTPVAAGQFYDIVGITARDDRTLQCTGTLIEADVVLTAGHCICGGNDGQVFFGDKTEPNSEFTPVKASAGGLNNCDMTPNGLKKGLDLGVLLLETPVTNVKIRSIAKDQIVDTAKSYRVVGFGAVDSDASVYPETKMEAAIVSVSNDCRGKVGEKSDESVYHCEPGSEIVAGRRGTPDTCNGDSGGPLLVTGQGKGAGADQDFMLAGVTSRPAPLFTDRMCGDGGAYERLDSVAQQWIAQTVAQLRKP